MDYTDFFLTTQKLYLIALALNTILIDSYPLLRGERSIEKDRTLDTIVTGVSELYHGLEAMVMAEDRCIPEE